MRTLDDEMREHRAHAERREIVLERERFCEQLSVDRVFIEEMGPRMPSFLLEHAYRLTLMVMATPLRNYGIELPEFTYPLDWWQALKARWFPAWALKRWPVQMKRVGGGRKEVEVRAIFPELDPMRDKYRIEYFVRDPGAHPERY